MKRSFRPGLKFVENQVNGCVSRLHCTWLVPRTKASSNDVDGFLTLRVDPLEDGRSTLRAWPNRYLRGHRIMLCGGTVAYAVVCNRALVRYLAGIDYEVPELSSDGLVLGSRLCPWSPTVALHVLLNLGVEAALMCLDLLKLPSCARNPHIGSSISFVKIIKEIFFL
ncbi:hypothetical protein M9H77_02836 [Catharanthus roseus]|uniref:Uncharacterized protein n=1 Tax=Catharanthus roseus TaxID=4058 RepID=A0ACC0C9G3_CATRO|nr:hypothetical protein M9H77_02836 [Catharanthus roseus]